VFLLRNIRTAVLSIGGKTALSPAAFGAARVKSIRAFEHQQVKRAIVVQKGESDYYAE